MKKTALLLIIVVIISSFVSCFDREYDEAEVKAAAAELLEKSKVINEIFYGEGMPVDESNTSVSGGAYRPADEEYLAALGISNVTGLRELTKEVYSEWWSDKIFDTKLSPVQEDGVIYSHTRYYDKKDKSGKNYIMVNTNADVRYDNDIEYIYDTLSVIGSEGEIIKIEIDVLLISKQGSTDIRRLECDLIEEDNGFRLDTLSVVKF